MMRGAKYAALRARGFVGHVVDSVVDDVLFGDDPHETRMFIGFAPVVDNVGSVSSADSYTPV